MLRGIRKGLSTTGTPGRTQSHGGDLGTRRESKHGEISGPGQNMSVQRDGLKVLGPMS